MGYISLSILALVLSACASTPSSSRGPACAKFSNEKDYRDGEDCASYIRRTFGPLNKGIDNRVGN